MSMTAGRSSVTLAQLVEAISDQRRGPVARSQAGLGSPLGPDARPAASAVVVVGAHPGEGASTVSVAVADAIADRGNTSTEVRLVAGAPMDASGLVWAASHDLGTPTGGWRTGRRGRVEVLHAVGPVRSPEHLPGLGSFDSGWLVVDTGWPLRDLLVGRGPMAPLLAGDRVVVVGRASVPGVRRMERALRDLAAHQGELPAAGPVVAMVGARRLRGEVWASFGPRLGEVSDGSRLVMVPADRALEVNGIEPRPLSRPVAAAARRLLDVLELDGLSAAQADQLPSRGRG